MSRWKEAASLVGKFAPLLGSAFGPGGSAIGAIVASALGVANEPDAIAKAIAADPDAAVKLREAELRNQEKLEQIGLDTFKAEQEGRANARQSHKHNPMPAIICTALTLIVGGGAYMLFTATIPDGNKEIAYLLFGTIFAKWGDSIAYWVGTTRGSAEKSRRQSS